MRLLLIIRQLKKEKILKKQNDKKESHRNKAKEFFCEKVEDHPKCDD